MFYSNCLIEAIKAKLADFSTEIVRLHRSKGESDKTVAHFGWVKDGKTYHFTRRGRGPRQWWRNLFYKGHVVRVATR